MNRYLVITARVWTVICGIIVILAVTQAAQSDGDYKDAIIFTCLALAPWAFIWIRRGALR